MSHDDERHDDDPERPKGGDGESVPEGGKPTGPDESDLAGEIESLGREFEQALDPENDYFESAEPGESVSPFASSDPDPAPTPDSNLPSESAKPVDPEPTLDEPSYARDYDDWGTPREPQPDPVFGQGEKVVDVPGDEFDLSDAVDDHSDTAAGWGDAPTPEPAPAVQPDAPAPVDPEPDAPGSAASADSGSGEAAAADSEPAAGEATESIDGDAAEQTAEPAAASGADEADEAADDAAQAAEVDGDDSGAPTVIVPPVSQPTEVHPAVKAPVALPRVPAPVGGVSSEMDLPEPKSPNLVARFIAGSAVIITAMAVATSVSVLLYLSDIASGLRPDNIPGIDGAITQVEAGEPQTILIVGSDRRAGSAPGDARSDTTMLVRLDPDRDAIALFSLPRDLEVTIPGVGPSRKLNEAYTIGGAAKTAKTVESLHPDLEINHLVDINFSGFAEAVDAIDCVYVDLDRKYFNDNATASAETEFAEIDINAGYQRLCGLKALQYVRYRHTDNDIVRAARQQDFLREARQQVGPKRLFEERTELIDIFGKYTDSDIDDSPTVLAVFKLFLSSVDAPVNEVHFEGDLGDATSTFVTASEQQINTAVEQFLGIEGTEGSRGGDAANRAPVEESKDSKKSEKKKDKPEAPEAELVEAGEFVERFGRTTSRRVHRSTNRKDGEQDYGVYVPKRLLPGAEYMSNDSRQYEIKLPDGSFNRAYKLVLSVFGSGGYDEFFGVMGTEWTDPPILKNPSETRTIGGRDFMLFYDGDRLRMVGWKTERGAYWISNTLLQTIDEEEMLGMAESMARVK